MKSRALARSTTRSVASVLLAALAGLAGCAAPPPAATKTTVLLLPDEDGKTGAVSVATATGSQTLDQAFSYAAVDGSRVTPMGTNSLSEKIVRAAYHDLLQAQPTQAVTFFLYFRLDRTELTAESKALLPRILATARARKPTEITLFGHADASGRSENNWMLSARRANLVAELLQSSDPMVGRIDVQYYGDKAPQVSTRPRAAEGKNRRVEVMIL